MKAQWQALAAKFAALQQREKMIVAFAMMAAIVMVGYSFWVEPAQLRLAALQKQNAKDKAEAQTLQTQVGAMKTQLKDPDAPNKAALAEAKAKLTAVERDMHQYDTALVPPGRMPKLLQSLFTRHRGLELVSLQTLPPTPLLTPPVVKTEGKAEAKNAPPTPAVKGGNILRHGIEIKMAGNYLDLLSYVSDLEKLPQKLLWGSMALAVTTYPKSEMTLVVYTLSLDSVWLVV